MNKILDTGQALGTSCKKNMPPMSAVTPGSAAHFDPGNLRTTLMPAHIMKNGDILGAQAL